MGTSSRVRTLDLRCMASARRSCVGTSGHHAQELIFVHAGVVAHKGRAILLPGHSFAGKSTLVVALVRAGAELFSDEFAMLDPSGQVAQYREPVKLRGPNGREELTFGSGEAQAPVPVGLVAFTVYTPGSVWSPSRLSPAEGVLAMMEHSHSQLVTDRRRPSRRCDLALANAEILRGERGEADDLAHSLLDAASVQER